MKSKILAFAFGGVFLFSLSARAQSAESGVSKSKVFMTTATYGVMAGSLVGLASMVFYDQPSKRTRNVAMGASIGLYTGILLGAYMIYFVPDGSSKASAPAEAPRAAPPPAQEAQPSLDSDDPLNIGDKDKPQGAIKKIREPIVVSEVQLPPLMPVAMYDGKHLLVGLDYRF